MVEKLLNYVHAADSDPSWEAHLPEFAAEIRRIFTNDELRAYFATTTRVGVAGHVCNGTPSMGNAAAEIHAVVRAAVTGAHRHEQPLSRGFCSMCDLVCVVAPLEAGAPLARLPT